MQDVTSDSNQQLIHRSQKVVPGGVHSPVRSFSAVGGSPLFISKAEGAYLFDANNQSYIDYVGSWGPMILGHAHSEIVQTAQEACARGLSFGAPCEAAVQLSELMVESIPSLEKVRMVNSGTEATMSALRLARGFTGRSKFIKFAGCYHGHADAFLVQAGSGASTLGCPSSAGVPQDSVCDTLMADYNNLDSVRSIFEANRGDIAAVIIEPVAGNMGLIKPSDGFLSGLRSLCDQNGALLIFDEVMTGFRVAWQGAQGLLGVQPDLTTWGKIIGGGMPVGAFGGRAEIMNHLAPLGNVYQAGTLSANPVAMAVGLKTLQILRETQPYEKLSMQTAKLAQGLKKVAEKHGVAVQLSHCGAMLGIFFTEKALPSCFSEVMACNQDQFGVFFNQMLAGGVYWAPSAFESAFVSCAHTAHEIDLTIAAAEQAFCFMAKNCDNLPNKE